MVFSCNLEQIRFCNFEPHTVYKKKIFFKNESSVPSRILVKGCQTPYFSIRRISGVGNIAPGMNVRYELTFRPKSKTDYRDFITVQSSCDGLVQDLEVLGSCLKPRLDGLENCDLGKTVVNQSVERIYRIKNIGGDAMFYWNLSGNENDCVLEELENEKEIGNNHFTVFPDRFQLRSQEEKDIVITFSGQSLGKQSLNLYLHNNFQDVEVYQLKAEAVYPTVELVNIDNQEVDSSTLKTMTFSQAYHNTQQRKKITYFNHSDLPISYHWEYLDEIGRKRISSDHVFSVIPSCGTIAPQSAQDFEIQFAPSWEKEQFSGFVLMMLDDIPWPSDSNHPYYRNTNPDFSYLQSFLKERSKANDPYQLFTFPDENVLFSSQKPINDSKQSLFHSFIGVHGFPKQAVLKCNPSLIILGLPLTVNQSLTKELTLSNPNSTSINFTWQSNHDPQHYNIQFTPKSGKIAANSTCKVILEFQPFVLGDVSTIFECVSDKALPLRVSMNATSKGPTLYIDKPAVDFGVCEIGKRISTTVQIRNVSGIPLQWAFTPVGESLDSEAFGENNDSDLHDMNQSDSSEEDHGVSLEDRNLDSDKNSSPGVENSYIQSIRCEPETSVLNPYESQLVTVHLLPFKAGFLKQLLPCHVRHGETNYIEVRAEVQVRQVYPKTAIIDCGTMYVDAPISKTIELRNASMLRTHYYWFSEKINQQAELSEQSNGQNCGVQVYFDEEEGILEPNSEIASTITITAQNEGDFSIAIPCFIEKDQSNYTGVLVRGKVLGLSLALRVYPGNDDSDIAFTEPISQSNVPELPVIDFGEVQLGDPKLMVLEFKNLSNVLSFFQLKFQNYSVPSRHSRRRAEVAFSMKNDRTSATSNRTKDGTIRSALSNRRSREKKTILKPDKSTFTLKKTQEFLNTLQTVAKDGRFRREMLQGRGCAFDHSLRNGRIDGNSNQCVELTCYSSSPGVYEDYLQIHIQPLPPFQLKVRAMVNGSPLQLLVRKTIGLRSEEKKEPLLLFPTTPIAAPLQSKLIYVKNTSNHPITCKWHLVDCSKAMKSKLWEENGRIRVNLSEQYSVAGDNIPFSIEPLNKTFDPGEVSEFKVEFQSNQSGIHRFIAQAIVSNSSDPSPLLFVIQSESICPQLDLDHKQIKAKCSVYQTFLSNDRLTKHVSLSNNTSTVLSFTMKFTNERQEPSSIFEIKDVVGGVDHPISLRQTLKKSKKSQTKKSSKITATNVSKANTISSTPNVKNLNPFSPTKQGLSSSYLSPHKQQTFKQRTTQELMSPSKQLMSPKQFGSPMNNRTPSRNFGNILPSPMKSPSKRQPIDEKEIFSQKISKDVLIETLRDVQSFNPVQTRKSISRNRIARLDQAILTLNPMEKIDLQLSINPNAIKLTNEVQHSRNERFESYRGLFSIHYSCGSHQSFATELQIHIPRLRVSSDAIDFSVQKAASRRYFKVYNLSPYTPARWRLSMAQPLPNVFYLRPRNTGMWNSSECIVTEAGGFTEIEVLFRPLERKVYQMVVGLDVECGMQYDITVHGTGAVNEVLNGEDESEILAFDPDYVPQY